MKKALHIVLLLVLATACGPRIISRGDMTDIMRDILLQDQQIKQDYSLRRQADTSLVFEAVFEKYGYNTDDFLRSVEFYLSDPSRMEKIMGKVADELEQESKVLDQEIKLDEWRDNLMRIYNRPVDTTRRPRPRVRPVDTLRIRFSGDSAWLHSIDSISMHDLDTILFPPVDSL